MIYIWNVLLHLIYLSHNDLPNKFNFESDDVIDVFSVFIENPIDVEFELRVLWW